jgi:hypothetical protein
MKRRCPFSVADARPRPRLCVVCHVDASWAWETIVPATFIKRDGRLLRSSYPSSTYYCDAHVNHGEMSS